MLRNNQILRRRKKKEEKEIKQRRKGSQINLKFKALNRLKKDIARGKKKKKIKSCKACIEIGEIRNPRYYEFDNLKS